jgi:prepilin-type N-terminal cleavage/methylation domain-containing protein
VLNNNDKLYKAFSLIELLVVIAIVAVLAAVAVPSYQQYRNRAIFVSAIATVEGTVNELKSKYQSKGKFPSSILFNGLTLNLNTNGGWSYVQTTLGNVVGLQYGYNSNPVGNGVVIWVFVKAPNITGYANPPIGADTYVFAMGIRDTTGALQTACGVSQSGNTPLPYLPANCQCADVGGWVVGTAPANCPP